MDGVNFFFCKEENENKRNSYISTIFFLQCIVSVIVSISVLCCTVPISWYFGNVNLRPLIIFVAVLPFLQNTISMLQIMFIAIGKSKEIALRNFLLSLLKFCSVVAACFVFDNIIIVLICQVILDIVQVAYFGFVLQKNKCSINVFKFDKTLIKEILRYCIPMAMFTIVKSINRDCC